MRRDGAVTSGLQGNVVAFYRNYLEFFLPLVVAAK